VPTCVRLETGPTGSQLGDLPERNPNLSYKPCSSSLRRKVRTSPKAFASEAFASSPPTLMMIPLAEDNGSSAPALSKHRLPYQENSLGKPSDQALWRGKGQLSIYAPARFRKSHLLGRITRASRLQGALVGKVPEFSLPPDLPLVCGERVDDQDHRPLDTLGLGRL